MKSFRGHFLIASPHLMDPNFVQTVVLLVQHNEEGAFGVVLNRPAENAVKELWEKVAHETCETEQRVHVGGPVPGPLMALHADRSLASGDQEIVPGVYLAVEREQLERLVHQNEHRYRIFVGHSGWGGGQLEGELKQGAWLTLPATDEYVFYQDADLWRKMTYQVGQSMLTSALKIKHVPSDPSQN